MSESKQRWRLVFGRDEAARYLSHLDAVRLWERALRRGRIPIAVSEGFSPRPRLIFAAPLPLGMLAEHELADIFLSERLTRRDLQLRLTESMPRGYRLIDLHDDWVGAPALATLIVAADYRIRLLGATASQLGAAARALLDAESLPREKRREKKVTAYDLRPLLLALETREAEAAGEARSVPDAVGAAVWMRLRHSQEKGSGRPEEVAAALADQLGLVLEEEEGAPAVRPQTGHAKRGAPRGAAPSGALEIVCPVRERLWLTGEASVDATGPEP